MYHNILYGATAQIRSRPRLKFLDDIQWDTHKHPVGLLYKSDQLVEETAAYTRNNKHKTPMLSAEFEPAVLSIKSLPVCTLHCTAGGIGVNHFMCTCIYVYLYSLRIIVFTYVYLYLLCFAFLVLCFLYCFDYVYLFLFGVSLLV
jgi:hypothetical protein